MKMIKLVVVVAVVALLLFLTLPSLSWAAEDGAALYKAKCAACHGANGEGKPAMKAPAVAGKPAADVEKAIAETAKHPAPVKGLSADDAKAIATYLQGLK